MIGWSSFAQRQERSARRHLVMHVFPKGLKLRISVTIGQSTFVCMDLHALHQCTWWAVEAERKPVE